ncbi:MAG: DNA-directed RNA polymerase subunit beta' [Clostridia bacterium]|nr:DNA-directed RNA polymerase subunit beta' [Oscillospiraceae bacterium]PWM13955.1 MAG: DNA-directed RNA polymerase subunit beta' [Clostridia bacterium]
MSYTPFDAIQIGIASPEMILSWSYGEVKKPETINYRTLKPERDGLFCERIFGPTKDWECHCGKYKKIRYKGKICDRCGVEVTKSKVRRERMGHIELAAPVSHIWYFKGIPSRMGLMLDLTPRMLEKVLYFANYIVIDPGFTPLEKCQILSEREYRDMREKYEDDFKAGIGAEAIKELLQQIDCDALAVQLREELKTASGQKKAKLVKRLEVVEAFRQSGNRPEWMVIDILPVIPPEIRPMVQLDGGRFATSDLNDLYRRVINRNNRLKRLQQLNAPDIIVRNEKRMLQEAVDALIDNGRRGRAVTGANSRALKSLSDMLKGKQGRFRQNLLGKRVDYSGRSVIVVGPDLKIYQCGVPKEMAIELFRPFVMKKLVEDGVANNIKSAKKMVDKQRTEVWDALEDVIKEHPVLLNRAPTLHRLGIQAFEPVLVEGRALRLHPLVCTAYNADFDGDQMAIHLPLSAEAQAEARILMLSANNLLRPQDGHPVTVPTQDMILGSYYLTMMRIGKAEKGAERLVVDDPGDTGLESGAIVDGDEIYQANLKAKAEKLQPATFKPTLMYRDSNEAIMAYNEGAVGLHAPIRLRVTKIVDGVEAKKVIMTTVGRIIFNKAIPQDLGYVDRSDPEHAFDHEISFQVGKKQLGDIIDRCIKKYGFTISAEVLDSIKTMGYKYSTKGAITISVADMTVPSAKHELIAATEQEVVNIERQYKRGFITDDERYRLVVSEWEKTTKDVTDALQNCLDEYNPIYMMANSGARGSMNQIRQLAGMRGLMANTAGKTIEIPIKSNFREGLSVLEYFISTRGARKGMADTALRTADSGYLTRRMVDVCQDVIIREADCGTSEGVWASAVYDRGQMVETFGTAIHGRFPAAPIADPKTGELLFGTDHMLMPEDAEVLEAHGIHKAFIRSVLTCEARTGVCAKCYGINLAIGKPVNAGEAVGVIAAQSIGEPGTQLTMRTFHTGGVAGDDITQGLPRVEELFEARKPKKMAILAETSGTVTIEEAKKGVMYSLTVTNEAEGTTNVYTVPHSAGILVHNGDHVDKGQELTSGALNPHDVLRIRGVNDDEFGRQGVRSYITSEVQKVYRQQGVDINDKHIEVIVRQMMRKVRVEEAGSTDLLSGATVDISAIKDANRAVDERIAAGEEGLSHATYTQLLMGITKASLATESFLSAASFQETTKVLTDAAIKGKVDHLVGLKENVIIGKLIPAGSGLSVYRNFEEQTDDTIAEAPEEYVDLSALVSKTNAL